MATLIPARTYAAGGSMAEQRPGVGARLTSADPQPLKGTVVRDDCGNIWENDGYYPVCWVRPDLVEQGIHDPETWNKIAGNYGPVTVLETGDEGE